MAFLPPNQQHQSTEGNYMIALALKKTTELYDLLTTDYRTLYVTLQM